MFSFQPTDRVFSENLVVIIADGLATFAILQSRTHDAWVRLTASTLEARQGYRSSDCFDTFPFPKPDPRTLIPTLEDIGARLYEARANYMVDPQVKQGLTRTYNQLKDPDCTEPRIVELRRLHVEMDRAVLAAYGWDDIEVPPYTTPNIPDEEKTLEAFQDEVIDRLFVLNAERAKEERLAGASSKKTKGKGKAKANPKGKKAGNKAQLGLLDEESE